MTDLHIGETVYVSDSAPATNDNTGFEALSWTQVKGVQQLPQLGITHSMIDIPDLQTGFTEGAKGAAQGRDTSMAFRDVDSDTGQSTVKTQANARPGTLSVKIVKGSGTDQAPVSGDPVEYASGVAHSYEPVQGDSTTHKGFTVSFRQNAATVESTEPV